MRELFYIKNRKNRTSKNKKNFYVRYNFEEGDVYKSIDSLYFVMNGNPKHISNKIEAYQVASDALEKGLVQSDKEKTFLVPFILQFWTYDESPYRKECEYEGKKLGKANFDVELRVFKQHCLEYMPKNLTYNGMTIQIMEDIKEHLRESNLSPSLYNKAMASIRQPLQYLYEKGKITHNFADKIKNIPQKNLKETGIFTTKKEIEAFILHLKEKYSPNSYYRWKYLIPALSYYSGMREGEIRALKVEDIEIIPNAGTSIIHVSHSYNDDEKEGQRYKSTKGKEKRDTYAPTALCMELLNFIELGPSPNGYIFFSIAKPENPINKTTISGAMREEVCESLGISEEERKERNLKFHSLRHMFNTTLVNSGMEGDEIRSMTGHKSQSMTDRYTHTTKEGSEEMARRVGKAIPYIK